MPDNSMSDGQLSQLVCELMADQILTPDELSQLDNVDLSTLRSQEPLSVEESLSILDDAASSNTPPNFSEPEILDQIIAAMLDWAAPSLVDILSGHLLLKPTDLDVPNLEKVPQDSTIFRRAAAHILERHGSHQSIIDALAQAES